ncbi:MAG TPA: phytanoyl-CoA dioxygenase family protein [Acidimicrobiales bacterium]|jgi:ectoine hydroxylase-related dioxygenase (phytanoyl-CoA dioxygenase family)|nr:phytanoyl-CoA dioxygenase family protein [Acidimicrobiales bacterium]
MDTAPIGSGGVTRHPLNSEFDWASPLPPFVSIDDVQAANYDENGYFVIEGAFDADSVTGVAAEIDPFEQELEERLRLSRGGKAFIARADEITFTTHLVTRSDLLRSFVATSILVDLCADLIGPDVRLYWDQAVYKKPHTGASFPWHQDNGYAFVEPQQYLTCWIALTDATEDNGCPWVVPGLHKLGTLRHDLTETGLVCLRDPSDPVPVPVGAGGIVVFSSLTPHCTGPNRTDDVRKSYIVQYAPDGAEVVTVGTSEGSGRARADAPDRQFRILQGGRPVA